MPHTVFPTVFGWVGLTGTERAVQRVLLPEPNRTRLVKQLGHRLTEPDDLPELMREVVEKIRRYFEGVRVSFDEPADLSSLPRFQRLVLTECRAIGYGETCSYGELAGRCGHPRAARAVGAAMARNPVPILIPCHRIIRSDGSLGGFGGGLPLKRRMLQLEGNAMSPPSQDAASRV